MFRIILIISAMFLLLLIGCSDDDTGTNSELLIADGPIMPLAVGNIWSGTQTTYYGATFFVDTVMYYITDSSIVNGEVWYLMDFKRSGTHLHYRWITYREEGGVFMTGCDAELNPDNCENIFKYPAHLGDTYCAHIDEDTESDSVMVTSIDGRFTYNDSISHVCYNYVAQCCKGDTMRVDTLIDTVTVDPLVTDTTINTVVFADLEFYSLAHRLGFVQMLEWNDYKYIVWVLDTAILVNGNEEIE